MVSFFNFHSSSILMERNSTKNQEKTHYLKMKIDLNAIEWYVHLISSEKRIFNFVKNCTGNHCYKILLVVGLQTFQKGFWLSFKASDYCTVFLLNRGLEDVWKSSWLKHGSAMANPLMPSIGGLGCYSVRPIQESSSVIRMITESGLFSNNPDSVISHNIGWSLKSPKILKICLVVPQ